LGPTTQIFSSSVEPTASPSTTPSFEPSQTPSFSPVAGSVAAFAVVNQVLSNISLTDYKKNEKAINDAIIQTVQLSAQNPSIEVQILNASSSSSNQRRKLSSTSSLLLQYKIIFPLKDAAGNDLSSIYD